MVPAWVAHRGGQPGASGQVVDFANTPKFFCHAVVHCLIEFLEQARMAWRDAVSPAILACHDHGGRARL